MPTDLHRVEARRIVTVAGLPPPADPAGRAQRQQLIDALAVALDAAEHRGAVRALKDLESL